VRCQISNARWSPANPSSVALVNRWFALWPDVPLVNAYGPTEAADDICQHVMRGPLGASETHVPIGTPIDNLSVLVLDQRCELVPVGVRGEICVAGVGVGPGIGSKPDRTAARLSTTRMRTGHSAPRSIARATSAGGATTADSSSSAVPTTK
jgi:non-ribosomal peptide synthetase component F